MQNKPPLPMLQFNLPGTRLDFCPKPPPINFSGSIRLLELVNTSFATTTSAAAAI